MTEQWPPPGHSFSWNVDARLDGVEPYSFDMTAPSTVTELNIATVRVGRHGGPNDRDIEFREQLHARLGAVVVASGHIESAMKRLLILLTEQDGQFSLVDKNWTELHRSLVREAEATPTDARRRALRDALTWFDENRIKERRDNAVHGDWWDFSGVGVARSRFFRRSDGTVIQTSLDELAEDARLLAEYAERLDDLIGEDWPRAMLPRD